jgi:hypothetical protein
MGFSMNVGMRELEIALPKDRLVCPVAMCRGEIQPCGTHKEFTMVTLTKYQGEIKCWLCTKCARHFRIGAVEQ